MKNIIWLLCGIGNIFIFSILAFFYAPNLNTGLAIDAYKYIAASVMWITSPALLYGFLIYGSNENFRNHSYKLITFSFFLILSTLIVSTIYIIHVHLNSNYKSFWIWTSIQYFLLLIILAAIFRTGQISSEITTDHELNRNRKSEMKAAVMDIADEILNITSNNKSIKKSFDGLLDEIDLLPNQLKMINFKEFNHAIRDLKNSGAENLIDYSSELVEGEQKIKDFTLRINKVQRLLAGHKNF